MGSIYKVKLSKSYEVPGKPEPVVAGEIVEVSEEVAKQIVKERAGFIYSVSTTAGGSIHELKKAVVGPSEIRKL